MHGRRVSQVTASAPTQAVGSDKLVGIRREDICFDSDGNDVPAAVTVVAPAASETHVDLDIAGAPVTSLQRQRVHPTRDQGVRNSMADADPQFFAKRSGKRLPSSEARLFHRFGHEPLRAASASMDRVSTDRVGNLVEPLGFTVPVVRAPFGTAAGVERVCEVDGPAASAAWR